MNTNDRTSKKHIQVNENSSKAPKSNLEKHLRMDNRDKIPARFALKTYENQNTKVTINQIQEIFGEATPKVYPLSNLDQEILILEFPTYSFDGENPYKAFSAAHVLNATLNVEAVEPDFPTNFYPDLLPPDTTTKPTRESVQTIMPGCIAPQEEALRGQINWALEKLHVPEAWEYSQAQGRPSRGERSRIAHIDTGVTNHPELSGARIQSGYDFLGMDPDPTDSLAGLNPGHGTSTASVIISPETLQLTGAAPGAELIPLRAIESVVRITQVTVAAAIDWAVEHGASIITMSLGGLPSFALHRALRRAVESDVIVIAAAGNCVGQVVWPARYPECIAVGGTDSKDTAWRGTCRGSAVDVSAPGQNVYQAATPDRSVRRTNNVEQGQGTSYSAALTAGVAALWLAHHGRANLIMKSRAIDENIQQMFSRLLRTTARRPSAWDVFEMGAGIVDASALLRAPLNAGRDKEEAGRGYDSPNVTEANSCASFITESTGTYELGPQMLDWHAYGPELINAILTHQQGQGTSEKKNSKVQISKELEMVIQNTQLEDLT